ncbi:MAG: large conductance mechanosensitive channel protein MscL [Planctomycetota bacterium JB042]
MGFIKEFKEFALKGNMVDMAVGIIIGGAFGGIVQSLIKDVVMPVVGLVGEADFTNLYLPLSDAVKAQLETNPNLSLEEAREFGPVLAWGNFATIAVNFLILAFVIFLMIKAMNNAKKKFMEEEKKAPPKPGEDIVLLREIRDSLKKA